MFLQTLTSLGILSALEITLTSDDQQTKSASIDILTYIVEFNPSFVRDYTLQQANTTDEVCFLPNLWLSSVYFIILLNYSNYVLHQQDQMLLNVLIDQMICDTDSELGGAVQLMGVLRILLDPENMMASLNKSEKTDFLNYFYKHSVNILIGMENYA